MPVTVETFNDILDRINGSATRDKTGTLTVLEELGFTEHEALVRFALSYGEQIVVIAAREGDVDPAAECAASMIAGFLIGMVLAKEETP